jgi:hypothetical protein
MSDTFTETTSQSWFSRMGQSIGGVIFGIVLFLASFVILWLNEGRAVKTAAALKEGKKMVISVQADKVDPANQGKLVHVSGQGVTTEVLTDPILGLSLVGIELARNVEMYQWTETKSSTTKEKVGGSSETVTTYTYDTAWSGSPHETSSFKKPDGHFNPAMQYKSGSSHARRVTLGDFILSQSLIGKIGGLQEYPLTQEKFSGFPGSIRSKAMLSSGTLYVGQNGVPNPSSPQVGDYRIKFKVITSPQDISLVAKQIEKTFEPYMAKNGREFELLEMGTVSAEKMFLDAENSNRTLTWILRLVGFLVMAIGLGMVFNPLRTLAAVLPFLGRLVGAGLGLFAGLVAFALSLVTIAVAWIAYRPVLGITLLVLAVGAIVLVAHASKKKAAVSKA